jgi:hypothetical protein
VWDFLKKNYPSNTSTENNGNGPMRLMAMKSLPQIAQDTGLRGPFPRKVTEKAKHGIPSVRSCTILLGTGSIR